ncbi:hypothetical protein NKF26_23870, partial [Haladaptatus sp. AB618]|uniref:hypothetical protein n=1 Tax=Haladaptatus sp. AB618 TaxID=2934173 RepID=UPI00209C6756
MYSTDRGHRLRELQLGFFIQQSAPHSSDFPKSLLSLTTTDELEQHPYRDPDRLQTAYEQAGTIAGTATYFDVSETAARIWLIHYGI